METHDDQDVRDQLAESEIELEASPERVWEVLTTDGGLSQWMGEGSLIEPEVGGEISVPDVATGVPKEGQIDWIEDARRLDFTWWTTDPTSNGVSEPATRVSIRLTPTETGTQVRVIERAATSSIGDRAPASAAWAPVSAAWAPVSAAWAPVSAAWAPASAAWAWRCSMLTLALIRAVV